MYFFCAEISWVSALHVSVSEHQLGRLKISHPSLFLCKRDLVPGVMPNMSNVFWICSDDAHLGIRRDLRPLVLMYSTPVTAGSLTRTENSSPGTILNQLFSRIFKLEHVQAFHFFFFFLKHSTFSRSVFNNYLVFI